jgi:hypothetical protein|uniref:hypothetical protein n=1 Tax=unclassified Variovorax TaxID=663243 RepID=UPI000D38791B
MAIDETRLHARMGNFVHGTGAAMHAAQRTHWRRASDAPSDPIFEARPPAHSKELPCHANTSTAESFPAP